MRLSQVVIRVSVSKSHLEKGIRALCTGLRHRFRQIVNGRGFTGTRLPHHHHTVSDQHHFVQLDGFHQKRRLVL